MEEYPRKAHTQSKPKVVHAYILLFNSTLPSPVIRLTGYTSFFCHCRQILSPPKTGFIVSAHRLINITLLIPHPQPLTSRRPHCNATEPNMPAGRPRKRSFVRTGQHSNRFAKRPAEPNPVPAGPDKAEEPYQLHYDSLASYNADGEWTRDRRGTPRGARARGRRI